MLITQVFAGIAGYLSGRIAARMSKRVPMLRRRIAAIPLIALLVFVLTMGANAVREALRYEGQCSGWQERGSHPCGFWEFVFQDWELGLFFSAIPILIGLYIGVVVFIRRLRKAAQRP